LTRLVVGRENGRIVSFPRPLAGSMPRRPLRRGLFVSVTALLAIPVILAVTLGTASLLAAVGDPAAAAACRWVALGLGIIWSGSVVATAAFTAIVSLTECHEPPHRRRRHRRHRGECRPADQRTV
jgi:hypothetical protein